MIKGFRFWLLYISAWLAYAASLAAVFFVQGSRPEWGTFLVVACNVAPAALLGAGVVRFCEYLTWREQAHLSFFSAHIVVSIFYAALWLGGTLLALSIVISIENGRWIFNRWGSYALQWQFLSGLMAYFTIASTVYVRQIGERLRVEHARATELEIRAARAEAAKSQVELAALRAQLNPHFLFNTLHSLMELMRTETAAAEEALERFAHLLRYVLRAPVNGRESSTDVSLADEWAFVESYLDLEGLRLGPRLRVLTEIDEDTLDCHIPAFTLQPIVENAIKHGIAPRAGGGTLRIAASASVTNVEGALLHVEVSDDGEGATPEQLNATKGLGLRLVRDSLAARYAHAAKLEVTTAHGAGFRVSLTIPCVTSREAPTEGSATWPAAGGEKQSTWLSAL